MRRDIIDKKVDIETWISQNMPKARICKELNCRPATLDSYLKKFGITYKGNMGSKGYATSPLKKTAIDFLFKGSSISSHKLKIRLLDEGIKQRICERCGKEKWLNEKIPLELHHVNRNRFDNRISNLELLCPNCHSLTDNYSGRRTKSS